MTYDSCIELKSCKGIPFRKIIIVAIGFFAIFLLIACVSDFLESKENELDWSLLFLAVNFLFIGGIALILIPNTVSAKLHNRTLELSNRNFNERIDISQVVNVNSTASLLNSTFDLYEFYKIDFDSSTYFGKTIYIVTKHIDDDTPTLGEKLKWIVRKEKTHTSKTKAY